MADRICDVKGCARVHFGRGYCKRHYDGWRRYGHPHGKYGHLLDAECSVDGCTRRPDHEGYCKPCGQEAGVLCRLCGEPGGALCGGCACPNCGDPCDWGGKAETCRPCFYILTTIQRANRDHPSTVSESEMRRIRTEARLAQAEWARRGAA